MNIKMNTLFDVAGISKQAFYQWKTRHSGTLQTMNLTMDICNEVRKDHPGMGLRTIWEKERPSIGRDSFINQGMLLDLGIKQKRNFTKTTDSREVTKFENIIQEIKLTGVNQVWVSDTTYFWVTPKWYYITLIMDLFSRKIVGYASSKTLQTEQTTLTAINYALRWRNLEKRDTPTVFHSDGGGQYYDKEWRKVLSENFFKSSMGKDVYENPNAEGLNRTVKEQYLDYYNIKNYHQLKKGLVKACLMYNEKPHSSLNKLSPN